MLVVGHGERAVAGWLLAKQLVSAVATATAHTTLPRLTSQIVWGILLAAYTIPTTVHMK